MFRQFSDSIGNTLTQKRTEIVKPFLGVSKEPFFALYPCLTGIWHGGKKIYWGEREWIPGNVTGRTQTWMFHMNTIAQCPLHHSADKFWMGKNITKKQNHCGGIKYCYISCESDEEVKAVCTVTARCSVSLD